MRWQVIVIAAVVALVAGAGVWFLARRAEMREREEARATEAAARELIAPVEAKLAEQAPVGKPDIDKTFAVLHALDQAARDSGSLGEYVEELTRQDYRGVDPAAFELRREMLRTLIPIAVRVRGLDARDAMWESYRALLRGTAEANAKTMNLGLSIPGLGSANYDTKADETVRASAVRELRESLQQRQDLLAEVETIQTELLHIVDRSTPIVRRLTEEWQRLCLVRDSAYLAAVRLDWDACERFAREAMEMSPAECEAHLLLALAQIEAGRLQGDGRAGLERYLTEFMAEHPDWAAPALVLRGRARAQAGDVAGATADFQLASSRYPLHAQKIEQNSDPYRLRGYLRRSTAGRNISGLYETMMLGSGLFSPELQLARLVHATNHAEGERLVREHFLRRRGGQSWTQVLYDVEFCRGLLKEAFQENFPEAPFLDIDIDGQDVVVQNRSDRSLHNVLVVLCLRFTNMHPDDYVALPVNPALPLLPPLETTEIGEIQGIVTAIGLERRLDERVEPLRAIVFSDEATFRVDTSRSKTERLQRRLASSTLDAPRAGASVPERVRLALAAMERGDVPARFGVARGLKDKALGEATVTVELPRELVLLEPSFVLTIGHVEYQEGRDDVSSRLEGPRVVVTFSKVDNELCTSQGRATLRAFGADADVIVRFAWSAEAAAWQFTGSETR